MSALAYPSPPPMPASVAFDRARSLGRIRLTGPATIESILGACRELYAHLPSPTPPSEIWDVAGARVSLGPEDLARIVGAIERDPRRYAPSRVALVSADPSMRMIARLLDARLGVHGRAYAAVDSVEAAEAWVMSGVEDPA